MPWRGWAHRLRAASEDGYLHGGGEVADHLDLALATAEYCHVRDLARCSQW
ncbi:hypothetical protein ACIQI7_32110 [Kitasatospora sp. NPDC092039]|uniref:hypothetical protein n=1 Tax=Kitasatospora sp. NPDC092039 TaxID=3364086 RepID=UPI003825BA47